MKATDLNVRDLETLTAAYNHGGDYLPAYGQARAARRLAKIGFLELTQHRSGPVFPQLRLQCVRITSDGCKAVHYLLGALWLASHRKIHPVDTKQARKQGAKLMELANEFAATGKKPPK